MLKLNNIDIVYDRVLLKNGDIQLYKGAFHLIKGFSGSGKTTLLYKIGLISKDKNYVYNINGFDVLKTNDIQQSMIRRYSIGYVLQDSSLFEQYNVIDNLKLYASFVSKTYTDEEYKEILRMVNLDIDFSQSIQTLSGGEKQRLAVACALCKQPEILILDEPTSALDKANEQVMFKVLKDLAHQHDICVVVASHSYYASDFADYIFGIEEQRLKTIKDSARKETLEILPRKSGFSLNFFWKYIQYFNKKFRGFYYLLILIMVLASGLSIFAVGFANQQMNQNIETFKALSVNQLFVTGSEYDYYISEMQHEITNDQLQQMQNIDHIQAIYPVYELKTNILEMDVTVVPYYDAKVFSEYVDQKVNLKNDNGAYLSSNLYAMMTTLNENVENPQITFQLMSSEEKKITFTQSIEVSASLKYGYTSPYEISAEHYLFIHQDIYEELMEEYVSEIDMVGYTIFVDDFEHLLSVKDELLEIGLGVNSDFVDIEQLQIITNSMEIIKIQVLMIILIIFISLLVVMQMNYFYKRNREFALLLINGAHFIDLLKLSLIETIEKLFVSSLIITLILYLITNIPITLISVSLFEMFSILFTTMGIIIIIFFLLTVYYLRQLNPEKVLRK